MLKPQYFSLSIISKNDSYYSLKTQLRNNHWFYLNSSLYKKAFLSSYQGSGKSALNKENALLECLG